MKKILYLILLMVANLHFGAGASELADRLKSEHYVLLMRHAYAPGVGDPPGFSLDRCESQRRLNNQGQAQARRVGQWLRQQGVQQARVFSSAWCRCQETAALLKFDKPEVAPVLGSFFENSSQAASQNAALQAFIAKELPSKGAQAFILVTHHVNILEYVGLNIGSGEMVLAKVDSQGRLLEHRLYPSP